MLSLIAKFDGEKIERPAELRGAAPADILIVYPAASQAAVTPVRQLTVALPTKASLFPQR